MYASASAGNPQSTINTGGGASNNATSISSTSNGADQSAQYQINAAASFDLRPSGTGEGVLFYLVDDLPYAESENSQNSINAMYDQIGGNTLMLLGWGDMCEAERLQFTIDRHTEVIGSLQSSFAVHNGLKQETNQLQSDRSKDNVDFNPDTEELEYLKTVAGLLLMLVDAGVLATGDVQPFLDVLSKIENGTNRLSPQEMATLYGGLLTIEPKLWHAQNNPIGLAEDIETVQRKLDSL